MMYSVEKMRNGSSSISDKRGIYKWWCTYKRLKEIADKLKCDINKCSIEKDDESGLYCVYVGVAVKETLKKRIEWHMGNHTDSSVKHKTLSTLKQSLSAIVYKDMHTDWADDLNNYMNDFYVSEDITLSTPQEIYAEEKRLLSEKGQPLYILNIQGNEHKQAPKKELKILRKNAWNEAMKRI